MRRERAPWREHGAGPRRASAGDRADLVSADARLAPHVARRRPRPRLAGARRPRRVPRARLPRDPRARDCSSRSTTRRCALRGSGSSSCDRPGYGLSTFREDRRLVDWPVDVAQLADHLGIEQFSVMGISGGGPHAAVCAALLAERVQRAAIVSGVGPLSDPRAAEGMMTSNQVIARLARRRSKILALVRGAAGRCVRRWPDKVIALMQRQLPAADVAHPHPPRDPRPVRQRHSAHVTDHVARHGPGLPAVQLGLGLRALRDRDPGPSVAGRRRRQRATEPRRAPAPARSPARCSTSARARGICWSWTTSSRSPPRSSPEPPRSGGEATHASTHRSTPLLRTLIGGVLRIRERSLSHLGEPWDLVGARLDCVDSWSWWRRPAVARRRSRRLPLVSAAFAGATRRRVRSPATLGRNRARSRRR